MKRVLARALVGLQMVVGLLFGALSLGANAHEMSIAEMTVREFNAQEFVWSWGAPGRNKPIAQDLTVQWPEGCTSDERIVRCGPRGLVGMLSIQGLGNSYSAALVRVQRKSDADAKVYTLTAVQPQVRLNTGEADTRSALSVASDYVFLGVEHILSGIDHLFFVISLLFLVGFGRHLVWTVSAFTLAHSVTLASSALGWLVLRSPPVEAVIALSIVLVSSEALGTRMTLTRQWPALVALLFGLAHGLGFAGALQDIGLPQQHIVLSLLGFNLGVEAGQFLVLALAWLLYRIALKVQDPLRLRRAALYVIGSVSAYWSLTRIVQIAL